MKPCRTVLLKDEPVDKDEFGGGHEKVAKAIVELIESEKGGVSIALTGTWGSGKSTVVKLIERGLSADTQVFIFDAWAHQGDPLKRSFLEALGNFLSEKLKWINKDAWKEKKKELARRKIISDTKSRPELTIAGQILLLFAFILPISLAIISTYTCKELHPFWLGFTWTFICLLGLFFIIVFFTKWGSTTSENFTFTTVLVNKAETNIHTETTETPEPTSIEFMGIFKKLIIEALGKRKKRKLIIVIDNLDRIAVQDALALWADMQAFFTFDSCEDNPWIKRLWLLVPFDHSALRRLWPKGEDNNKIDLVKAFTEKTFQITFRVPAPVLSDWHQYFMECLAKALPEHDPNEFRIVFRIFDLRGKPESRPLAPRDIIIFINKLGAIHRQWQDEIPLPQQALYVVLEMEGWDFEEALIKEDAEKGLEPIPMAYIGPDWRDALAAIHFNVEKEKAIQILLEPKIKAAIDIRDSKEFEELQNITGFSLVLHHVIEQQRIHWIGAESWRIPATAAMLTWSDLPVLPETWQFLYESVKSMTSLSGLDREMGEGFLALMERRDDQQFFEHIIDILNNSPAFEENPEEETPTYSIGLWIDGILTVLSKVKDKCPDLLEKFSVAGSAKIYIAVMGELAAEPDPHSLHSFFKPATNPKQVVSELAQMAEDGKFTESHADAVESIEKTGGSFDWKGLISSLETWLGTFTSLEKADGIIGSFLVLLRLSKTDPQAQILLTKIVTNGEVLHLLFYAGRLRDAKAKALCLIPILEHNPAGPPDPGRGNTAQGRKTYSDIITNPDSSPDTIKQLIEYMIKLGCIEVLFSAADEAPIAGDFIYHVISEVAEREDAHRVITPGHIEQHNDILLDALTRDIYTALLKRSVEEGSLIEYIIKGQFDIDQANFYLYVLKATSSKGILDKFLIEGLRALSKDEWLSDFENVNIPFVYLANELISRKNKVDLEVNLHDALLEHAKQILEESIPLSVDYDGWDRILMALSDHHKITFLEDLLSELCLHDGPTDDVLQIYGDALIDEQVIMDTSKTLFSQGARRFLVRLTETEISWLMRVVEKYPLCFKKINPANQKTFKDRVQAAYKQENISDEVGAGLERIAKALGIKLNIPDSSDTEENT